MTDPAETSGTPGARRPRGRPRTSGDHRCDRCGRSAGKLRTRWPDGGICGTCYHDAVRTFGNCARCGHHRMLPGRAGDDELCRACARITTDLDCHRCGVEAEHYRRGGLCARCALRDDLTALFTHDPTDVVPVAASLIDVLCAAERPESIHTWKRRARVQQLLTGIGDGSLPATHEAFDRAGSGKDIEHLRDLLVHHGLLEPRDRDLALFERWLRARLDDAEPDWARRLLEQYATWHHLRAIRNRLSRGLPVRGSVHNAKQEITEIGRLLIWLDEQEVTLATCPQGLLDRWLVDGPSTRYIVRTFIRWAGRQKLAPDLHVTRRTTRSSPSITEQTRLDWLVRCLRDEPGTRAYRVAAILLLLYAQPIVRIAALRRDQILSTPDGPAILLGAEPAALPSPFAELLLEHLANRPNMQTGNSDNPWVFPSIRAGQHIRPDTMMKQLRNLGIDLRGARNTALNELVQRVPAPIVATQLGYHPGVTQRHAEDASAPLGRYASLASLHSR